MVIRLSNLDTGILCPKVSIYRNNYYLCDMKRKIRTYGGYFEAFMATLKEKEQEKIQYGLLLLKTQDRLPKKFVKLIRDGLYELRTEYNGNIYRVFFIFDEGQIIVLFNGFQKKDPKDTIFGNRKGIKNKGGILWRQIIIRLWITMLF